MVRVLATVFSALVIGIALGNFQTRLTTSQIDETFYLSNHAASIHRVPDELPISRGIPKVELPEGNSFDFGQMQHGSSDSHEFVVRNVGEGPLVLEKTGSTCKCTVGELEDSKLLPGQETRITLTWRAQTVADRFGQAATFRTNDPLQPELRLQIEGTVIDSFVFEPSQLSLGDFSSELGVTKEVKVYCYTDEDVEIERMEWSNVNSLNNIRLDLEPISPKQSQRHSSAAKAYRVTLTASPGMPVGPLSSKISFITNHGDEIELPTLDVNGRVVSDISIVGGSYFKSEKNVLDIGNVSSREGFTTSIWLVLRGDLQEVDQQIGLFEVSVEQLDGKDSLVVTVGESKIVNQRTMVPIQFEVPIGASEAYYPGTSKGTFARVIIRTNSSKLPELPIYVKLVVKN